VVIDDLDFVGAAVPPRKAKAPLVIDADTVLALAIALQALQAVSRQQRERSHVRSRVQHVQFPQALTLNGLKPAYGFPAEEALRISAAESPDHVQKVYCCSVNVKQYEFRMEQTTRKRSRDIRMEGSKDVKKNGRHFA